MMKKKQTVKRASLSNGLRIPQIKHGSTTITLEDVNTGEKKVYHDDNMQTNGINAFLRNCGWLNRDNLTQSDLVTQLLGGVMLFNAALPEDADGYKLPTEVKMIANSGIGASNLTQTPSELGSFLADQSGWDADHRVYTAVYHWLQAQGNCTQDTGPIQCVCACPQSYGLAGEGNVTSAVKYTASYDVTGLQGTVTEYSGIVGEVFGIDLERSVCYALDLTGASESHKGILRKYRLPISKINLAMTPTAPVQLPVEYNQSDDPVYDKEITLPEAMYTGYLKFQPFGGNLLIWNACAAENNDYIWGTNYTQYLWTLEPDGTLTEETLLNTSGDTLHGLQNAIFDGDYAIFNPTDFTYIWDSQWRYGNDTRTIYILKRSTGAISKITNPFGNYVRGNASDLGGAASGWMPYHTSGDGRFYISGYDNSYVVDAKAEEVYITNSLRRYSPNYKPYQMVDGLIKSIGNQLYRDQMFLSTINNLSEPVTKDPSKAMTVQYRFEFEDDDLWDVEEAQNNG